MSSEDSGIMLMGMEFKLMWGNPILWSTPNVSPCPAGALCPVGTVCPGGYTGLWVDVRPVGW